MQPKTHRLLSVLLLIALLLTLAAPALAQEPSTAAAVDGSAKTACAAFSDAEQRDFDALTAMKAAETLAGADLARYDALAQQLSCYSARLAAPVQDAQPKGATRQAPTVTKTVGTSGADYATLKLAFDDINNGTLTGSVQLDVIDNTTETVTAVLNASGSGSASYTAVLIQPSGGVARMISGIISGDALVTLNGADNVTIDGLNTGGNALTLSNTSTASVSGTSTLKFITDATNNTVTKVSILGSATLAVSSGTNGGNIWFAAGAVTTGNDNNIISNSNIGPAGSNLPTRLVWGNGTTTTTTLNNSGVTITNNNIYDFFSATAQSRGIDISSGNTDWTISNNRLYQTASRNQTTASLHAAIYVSNTSGNNFQITGNTIGYAASNGTGIYALTGTVNPFHAIYLNVGTTTTSSVQGNTIAAISMTTSGSGTSSSAPLRLIYVASGLTAVGDVTGNTIGSQSTTGSISFTSSSTSASDVIGIFNFGSSNWTVSNNTIGGITAANSSTGASNVYGIRVFTASGVTFVCQNNTIGGTVANSIQSTSTATGTTVQGILNSSPIGTITGNLVRNLTAAGGTGTTTSASVIGISITASANQTIGQNTIYNLSNTNATAASVVTGIQFTGGTANVVERNLIYGLTAATNSTSAEVNGIRVAGGTTTYRNNMIAIGAGMGNAIGAAATNSSTAGIVGINEALGTDQFFHNSVYIGGTATAGSGSSFAFNGVQTTNTRSFRDNIFFNARSNSGATGKHYAVKINGTAPNPTGLTINNNVYYANGSGAVFGFFNSLDVANLAAWKTAVGQDANSFEADPLYVSTTDLHLQAGSPAIDQAFNLGVTNDFDGDNRLGANAFFDIGADERDGIPPVANDMQATAFIDPTNGGAKLVGSTFSPQASFTNNGTASQSSVTVRYRIVDASLVEVYNQTATIASIASLATANVTFPSTSIGTPGTYTIYARSELGSDTVPANDQIVGTLFVLTPLAGTYTVGSGGNYPSLTNNGGIFQALNSLGASGNIAIDIISDLTGETGTHALNEIAGGYTVLIKPSGAPRTITGSNAGALIRLNGADRVRIDGWTGATFAEAVGGDPSLRELTIQNTNTGTSAVVIAVQSGSNGAQSNTLKNLNVLGQDPTTTLAGIALGGNTPGTVGTDNDGNRVENCTVKRVIYGIYAAGASAANPNLGTVITQNDLSATTTDRIRRIGIVVFNEDGVQITENSVGGIETNESADAIGIGVGTQGIDATTTTSGGVINAFVSRNKVNGVNSASTVGFSAAGIAVAGGVGGANTIVNNMISGVTAPATSPDLVAGIFVAGVTGSDTRLVYNSISMTGDRGTVATQMPSFGIAVTGADPTVVLRNNIFATTQIASGGGVNAKSYAIGMVTTTFVNLDSNYNVFYSAGANAGGYRTGSLGAAAGADYATLAAWQTAVSDDANSVAGDPLFVSNTDLHLSGPTSPASNTGTPIAGITIDIDGDTRSTVSPDIGADEILPLAVTLASFTAQGGVDRIVVDWVTVSEFSNAGFNLYRSSDPAGPQTLLGYLPSQGPGSTQGFAYSFEDLDVQAGQTYWYWLEDVSLSGATTLHGPVSATVQAPTAVTLSSVSASPAAAAGSALPWLLVVAGAGAALAAGRRRRQA